MVTEMVAAGVLDEAGAVASTPLGRLGRADEIAAAVLCCGCAAPAPASSSVPPYPSTAATSPNRERGQTATCRKLIIVTKRAGMCVNRHDTEIAGTVDQVWAVLGDLGRDAEWNPTIRRACGELRVGGAVEFSVGDGASQRQWTVRVVRVEPGREFAWTFHETVPVLFRGDTPSASSRSTTSALGTWIGRPSPGSASHYAAADSPPNTRPA
jgi:hypothetical protein